MLNKFCNHFLSVAVLSFISLSGLPEDASAQTSKPNGDLMDRPEISQLLQKYQSETAKIDQWAQKLDAQLPAREFLTQDEGRRFDALIVQPNSSSTTRNQLQALVKVGLDRRQEYARRTGGPLQSPEELPRFRFLKELAKSNQKNLSALVDRLRAILQQQQEETDNQFTDKVNKRLEQKKTTPAKPRMHTFAISP